MRIMVSACLLGEDCKYNGGNNRNDKLVRFLDGHEVIPVCPEVLGGLTVPRVPCEISGGEVVDRNGVSRDVQFRKGACLALALALEKKVDMVVLQPRSPSCGVGKVYDGSFSGRLVDGNGVFAAMAIAAGLRVVDVDEYLS